MTMPELKRAPVLAHCAYLDLTASTCSRAPGTCSDLVTLSSATLRLEVST